MLYSFAKRTFLCISSEPHSHPTREVMEAIVSLLLTRVTNSGIS